MLWDTIDADNGKLSDTLLSLSDLFEQDPGTFKDVFSSLADSQADLVSALVHSNSTDSQLGFQWNSMVPKSPAHEAVVQSLCKARNYSQVCCCELM